MKNKLTKSLENYLLTIDTLLEKKETIIVKDVAEYLKIGGASTSEAVKKLRQKGYINYEPYGNITLTPLGEKTVIIKKYRHNTITKFLNKVLDIDIQNAELNAEQIEYSMTEDVLTRLVNFMDFMEQCTCKEPKWLKSCKSSLEEGKLNDKCQSCQGGCCCGK
ncbi:metal-dependent transcriptional regulator [bacterium]|nr:metal-dependent transcriptional regulator [bacterium]